MRFSINTALRIGASSKLNLAASALVTCSALGFAAGCAAQPQTVSVRAGGSSAAATASASSSPTRPAKPAAERLPDSSALTVTAQTVPGPASAGHAVVLTNAATIKEIAADINALPTLPSYTGVVHCPMETVGSTLALEFRDSASGPVLAEVQLGPKPSGECSPGVQVTVGGVTEPRLDDSGYPKLYARLEQLAGLTSS
jgi:hypothetical protein